MPKRITRVQANKAHKAMIGGLLREYRAGILTKTEYDRLRKRAIQLHKEDLLLTK